MRRNSLPENIDKIRSDFGIKKIPQFRRKPTDPQAHTRHFSDEKSLQFQRCIRILKDRKSYYTKKRARSLSCPGYFFEVFKVPPISHKVEKIRARKMEMKRETKAEMKNRLLQARDYFGLNIFQFASVLNALFHEEFIVRATRVAVKESNPFVHPNITILPKLRHFIALLLQRTQVRPETCIIAMLNCARIHQAHPIVFTPDTCHLYFFISVLLTQKMYEDYPERYMNIEGISGAKLAELELHFLFQLDFSMFVKKKWYLFFRDKMVRKYCPPNCKKFLNLRDVFPVQRYDRKVPTAREFEMYKMMTADRWDPTQVDENEELSKSDSFRDDSSDDEEKDLKVLEREERKASQKRQQIAEFHDRWAQHDSFWHYKYEATGSLKNPKQYVDYVTHSSKQRGVVDPVREELALKNIIPDDLLKDYGTVEKRGVEATKRYLRESQANIRRDIKLKRNSLEWFLYLPKKFQTELGYPEMKKLQKPRRTVSHHDFSFLKDENIRDQVDSNEVFRFTRILAKKWWEEYLNGKTDEEIKNIMKKREKRRKEREAGAKEKLKLGEKIKKVLSKILSPRVKDAKKSNQTAFGRWSFHSLRKLQGNRGKKK